MARPRGAGTGATCRTGRAIAVEELRGLDAACNAAAWPHPMMPFAEASAEDDALLTVDRRGLRLCLQCEIQAMHRCRQRPIGQHCPTHAETGPGYRLRLFGDASDVTTAAIAIDEVVERKHL